MSNGKLTIYDQIDTHLDNVTGEIVSTTRKSIKRRESTPEFTMLFVHGLSRLTKSDLTKAQAKVLFELLKYTLNNSNMILVNKEVKTMISSETKNTFRTVEMAIQSLVSKEVILKVKTSYYLNPIIFGRGNFQNVKKLTQALSVEYDFENEIAVENQTMRFLYNEDQDMNKLKVIESTETVKDNVTEQEIIVEEIGEDNNPKQARIDFNPTRDNELDLIKEKNKQLELENQQMKLKLEMKREGLL